MNSDTHQENPMIQSDSDLFVGKLLSELTTKPSLTSIFEAQDESAKVGFDFPDIEKVREKVEEELGEMLEAFQERSNDFDHFREELGDCFFALVNMCRHAGIDPEVLARENAAKYLARCEYIERFLTEQGKNWKDLSPSEIGALWKQAKVAGL
jgi:uncharacterized protein YabN with tetrapyrrole methylase and pyrophosphatase domain